MYTLFKTARPKTIPWPAACPRIACPPGAKPTFHKARPVYFEKKKKVSEKLDQLESQGIIEKVQYIEWAAPIVAVDKPDGGVRICGDFNVTVNPELEVDKHPLPRIDEIFANLAGGEKFSKLDLSHAYLQMEVAEEFYGIASAPALWQKAMDQVLQGLPSTQCYIDDIIITAKNDQEYYQNLENVLSRLEEAGLKLNKDKCKFMKDEIEYCGHLINKDGLRKTQKKIEAVINAPSPQNVNQLRSWLGFVNYYHKFLPNLASELQPLHTLLKQVTPWHWKSEQKAAFTKVKSMVASDTVLTHYDPDKELRLATDASAYGLGCVLSHVMLDGTEKPIAFASRTLNDAEKLYPQLQKEALPIVWGVKKF
ncbi:Retrovirus-related Pol polyprotein from transposon 297 [Exaiptasia diaphana]|nr:Retrovirus-related Pol polyprotein from transposon 297 [Exaiptasia diaphana]